MGPDLLRLAIGGVCLYLGAEWLVKGSAGLARAFGVPPLVVGLTIIGYGTSAPELTVSVVAAVRGSSQLALGNVVGSNIANLGLILGVTALVSPPKTDGRLVRREVPLLLATTAILPLVLLDGRVGRLEGALLLAGAIGVTVHLLRAARRGAVEGALEMERAAEEAGAPRATRRSVLALLAILGLGVLVFGGNVFVGGAIGVARRLGLDDRLVGLTVVAVGTSLPELATSLVAAKRGHADLAVGNVIGSNLFNVLLVLGATAVILPVEGDLRAGAFDLAVLAVMTIFAAVMVRTARVLRRWEGAVLVAGYVGFLVALVLRR